MHISLDAALQRQPLLSTVGDKLLPKFPGAAAAYSLRALNGDANDVVKVRRDADNEERDFTAEGVQFELADWVNGKQETTLPCDVATPAAAYSLRKVKAGYTGDAVRIRRASDDVEVDVAFDANDEVSTSSAITNPESIFPTSVAQNRTGSARYDTFTTDGLNSFSATCTSVALGGYIIDEGQTGDVVTVSFDATINSGSIAYVALRADLETGGNASNLSSEITSSGSYSFDLTATNIYSVLVFVSTSVDFTVSNVSIIARPDQGDTTTTTLGAFLAEELTAYSSDFTTTDGWFGNKTTITANVDEDADGAGVPPSDDFLKMVADGAASPPRLSIRGNSTVNNYVVGAGGGDFEVTFDYYAPQDISTFKVIVFSSSGNPQFGDNDQIVAGSGSWSATVTLTEAEAGGLTDFRVGSTTDQTGKTLYIKNLQIKRSNHNATVATWYDQEGSNNATQGTAASQPKIAEGGSLLTTGVGPTINFYNNSFLETPAFTDGSASSVFSVVNNQSADTSRKIFHQKNNFPTAGYVWNYRGEISVGQYIYVSLDGDANNLTFSDTTSPFYFLSSTIINGNKEIFINGTSKGSSSDSFVADSGSLLIGSAAYGNGFDIQELILYPSDQSANRFKIESNINNHYGIYTAAEDGFVNTWYDQSGNSIDAVAPADVTEPKIVNAGSLINNGKSFSGANVEMLTLSSDITLSNEFSIFYKSDFSARSIVLGPLTGTEPRLENVTSSRVRLASGGDADFDNGVSAWGDNIFTLIKDSSNDITLFENGTSKETVNKPSPTDYTFRRIFSFGGNINARLQGEFSELVIYNSDQSANRTDIESNITSYYS